MPSIGTAVLARFLSLVLLLAVMVPARALDTDATRQTLKGIKTVLVDVRGVHEEAIRYGITKSSIQTDVELKLRRAGIKVSADAGMILSLRVELIKVYPGDAWIYDIELEFYQRVQLERDPEVRATVPTWSSAGDLGVVTASQTQLLRDAIKDQIDVFLNAYLSANPK